MKPVQSLEQLKEEVLQLRQRVNDLEAENKRLVLHNAQYPDENDLFQILMGNARDIIFLVDLDGRILKASQSAVDAYGYIHPELLSKTIFEIRGLDEKTSSQMKLASSEGIIFETTHFRKDGSSFPVEVNSTGVDIGGHKVLLSVIRDITERKKAEEILRSSEERFSKAFHSCPAGMILSKFNDGEFFDVNESFLDTVDFKREEVIGKTSVNLGIWADLTERSRFIQKVRRSSMRNEEFLLTGKSGVRICALISSEIITINGEECILASILDITDRKKKEEMLRRQADLLDLAHEAIFTWDLNGGITFWNQGAQQLYGYSAEEALGQVCHKLLKTVHTDGTEEFLTPLIQNRMWAGELIHIAKDGRVIFVETRLQLIQDDSSRLIVLEIARDVTERKRLVQALQTKQEELTTSNEELQAQTEELTAANEELMAQTEEITAANEELQAQTEELNAAYKEMQYQADKIREHMEVAVRARDESELRRTELQTVLGELSQAKAAAEAANQAKSSFLANMSHEIRTPMNGIIGLTDLLLMTDLNDSQRENLELIQTSADILLQIINDILDLSKIESGKMELNIEEFDIIAVMITITKAYEVVARKKETNLTCTIDSGVPGRLKGDMVRLKQIIENLVNNAIKFTEKGSVTLNVSRIRETSDRIDLKFEISDTGIGIARDKLAEIFERFQQADQSTTKRFGGTGLGLAIVKHLVKMMSGIIRVESEPGKGSIFTIEIPFLKTERVQEPVQTPEAERSSKEHPPIRILLAEDNEINQKTVSMLLTHKGYDVVVVENGRQALTEIDNNRYDLILMDIQMPEVDGFEATARIRETERKTGRHIPIVALTAYAMEGDRKKCLRAGMDEYLAKPVKIEDLYKIIEKMIQ